ncbi:hypothetical protein N6H18_02900 [Reichenbachiella agarivorans]|uniref:Putative zinc-finger domain-containing protein n=1 Tax=Reichenbachiella agarivorans TaxID=2979464 RepID=A0ABY6CTW2_9BACT|nr:hypothetical protein [Reichenbachiella agarivorans]UXP32903.1 hypothetical protein N6H18_02900 [Reichenbachiella agarivorans]
MGLKQYVQNVKFRTGMANCREYIDLIYDVIDNQSSPSQEQYLRRHLKLCLKCVDALNLEKELKKAIQLKSVHQEVPKDLADSIKNKIAKSTP